MNSPIYTLDLNFQGISQTIASYMIPHEDGVILVESGPGSTLPGLDAALAKHGYHIPDVTDVLITHIHLDHAGAAGYLARQGAEIHVHEFGAKHLLNPEKLLEAETVWNIQLSTIPERLPREMRERSVRTNLDSIGSHCQSGGGCP
jgi:glyoxylase-like metal-dependent hydrolase (beta-lactamase superfamily II)